MGSSLILLVSFLLLLNDNSYLNAQELGAKNKVHIVYLGERQHNDTDIITELHHQMLESVLGSKEAAVDSLVHSYKHGFSGFAAKLTESQAQQIAGRDEVISVVSDHLYTVQTTRTWDYLGLSVNAPNNLLHQTNMGDGVIVGVIDSGIWPESKSFNDQGLGPVPRRWKGRCAAGEHFNAKTDCNRKLIGAKWFSEGFEAQMGKISGPDSKILEFRSPRDAVGHGTHTAATAAGAIVHNVHYKGLARGFVRGGASRARIAMYKACWGPKGQCSMADLLKAFDEAIHDGVDLLSISLGSSVPLASEVDFRDISAFASFYAVARGIPVICAGGNTHLPLAQTVVHTAPWILTVAATTVDRSFPTLITLGNNVTLMGQSLFTGQEIGFSNLVHIENSLCEDLSFNHTPVAGKVVLCFTRHGGALAVMKAVSAVQEAGGAGVIVAKNPTHIWVPASDECPYILVDYELGHRILFYIRSSRSPMVKIKPSKSLTGRPTATEVAYFSCRGPSSTSPAILKPDIGAPGAGILAASSPLDPMYSNGFALQSGTSMATPHVSGIVALLKAKHPDWSPAAIKSAIVTTAWKTDPLGEPIFAEGSPQKLADPFDYGGGLVNPEKAADPGLIYDMGIKDYIHYLCAMKYSRSAISLFVGQKTKCQKRLSTLDLNLPSITIPSLKSSVTLTRTVTNVGPVDSTYKSFIESPLGTTVKVSPEVLVFNSTVKFTSFNVIVSTTHKVNTGYFFGSLTWSDGVHHVTSPISVRTKIIESYVDDF